MTAKGSQAWGARRAAAGPNRTGRPRPRPSPGTVPLLTRWEAADSARAVPAAGLRGQKAPPHRGREGRWTGDSRFPTLVLPPPSPPASSAAETCAEPGPRRHPREGGLVNGCSATSGERSGQIRRGGGGSDGCGCCHSRAGWACGLGRGSDGSAVAAARFPAEPRLSGSERSFTAAGRGGAGAELSGAWPRALI